MTWSQLLDADGGVTCAYVDDRALRVASEASLADELLASGFAMEIVSPSDGEQLIVRISRDGKGQVDAEILERLAVAKVFVGDEFRAGDEVSSVWLRGPRDGGKSVAFSSREMFSVTVAMRSR